MNSIDESPYRKQHPNELDAAFGGGAMNEEEDDVKFLEVGDGHKIGPYNVSFAVVFDILFLILWLVSTNFLPNSICQEKNLVLSKSHNQ